MGSIPMSGQKNFSTLISNLDINNTNQKAYEVGGKKAFLYLPYIGNESSKVKRQVTRLINQAVPVANPVIVFKTKNLHFLNKSKQFSTPTLNRSHVVYCIKCSECHSSYIGFTCRILRLRVNEHSKDNKSAIKQHSLTTSHLIDFDNVCILDKDSNKMRLFVKESFKILEHKPDLNRMTSSFDIQLFV